MLYVVGSLASLPLLFGVWALAGCAVERALGLDLVSEDRSHRWLRRFGLGASAWILALFGLAAFQALEPLAIWALVAISLGGGAASLLANRARPALEQPVVASRYSANRLQRLGNGVLWIAIAASGVVLLLQALRPDISWDANVYHLTLPRLYLEHGGFFRVPWNVYSNWPLGLEMLFGAAMALRDYGLAKLVHFGFGALTAVAVFRLAGRRSALWAVAALLFNPVVLYEIRIAYVDLGYAFFLLLGAASLSTALDAEPGSRLRHRELLLAGIAGGTLCAIKLNGFFGLAVLAGLWGWRSCWSSDAGGRAGSASSRRCCCQRSSSALRGGSRAGCSPATLPTPCSTTGSADPSGAPGWGRRMRSGRLRSGWAASRSTTCCCRYG